MFQSIDLSFLFFFFLQTSYNPKQSSISYHFINIIKTSMLTYKYHMPKRIDLKQLGQAREFDFYYYYSFSENQNHLSIYVGKKKTYTLFTILQNVSGKSGWKL